MPPSSWPTGPAELVEALTQWAREAPWVEWLELGGSLGRGAGDERSDLDAGVGVDQPADRLEAIEAALARLAPVAATLRQSLGDDGTHVITVYDDGRQVSLVVLPAASRKGLPPQAIALVDKTGRLDSRIDPDRWTPNAAARREWTFLTCIALSGVHKHARRGNGWRAVRSLNEARDLYLQLLAASEGVTFPQFGAVSLQNAARPVPDALESTLVDSLDIPRLAAAAGALRALLQPFVAEHGLQDVTQAAGLDTESG